MPETDDKDSEMRTSIETEMLSLSNEMKRIAMTYQDHLIEDNKTLEKISNKQDKNLNKLNQSFSALKLFSSESISCWQLIIMFIFAAVLFFFTTFVIVIDLSLIHI
eukprot:TRINITY_DN8126_c0_g3_i1.p1 TRINITY_DN8126_c0_g3~~TRINITY_DN8126_c0_g3_i1.p1  ORF type:complete len:106 (-),score=20.96 TRINITY_DN8126_c0_g3_i1:74-391(-)